MKHTEACFEWVTLKIRQMGGEERFKQLMAERIQTKFVNGHPTLHILNPNLEELAESRQKQRKTVPAQPKDWVGYDDWNFN